jgi:hypothetical protein
MQYSGRSRNFEKGSPLQKGGGNPPKIAKKSRILGLKSWVLLTFDGKFRAKRVGPPLNPPLQYKTRVNAVLHCGLMRVNAVRTGSIRIHLRNRNPCKNFEHDQNHFLRRIVLTESITNWHGLRCGSIRMEPGRYGFNSVWTRFEIRLCVTAFPECRPHSKLFWPVWTCIQFLLHLHRPLSTRSGKYKRKACETVLTRFEPQRLVPTRNCPFHIPVTNF